MDIRAEQGGYSDFDRFVDPMIREMQMLEDENSGKKAAREAKKSQQQAALDADQKRAELELKRRELALKEQDQIHKQHLQTEKVRVEQMKALGGPAAAAPGAKRSAPAPQNAIKPEDDTMEKRDDLLRKIHEMQERLDAQGSGRRLTLDSSAQMLQDELDLMHRQLNLERAGDMPEALLLGFLQTVESAAVPFVNIQGTTADFQAALEASKKAPPKSLDSHLDRAMIQCSIKVTYFFP